MIKKGIALGICLFASVKFACSMENSPAENNGIDMEVTKNPSEYSIKIAELVKSLESNENLQEMYDLGEKYLNGEGPEFKEDLGKSLSAAIKCFEFIIKKGVQNKSGLNQEGKSIVGKAFYQHSQILVKYFSSEAGSVLKIVQTLMVGMSFGSKECRDMLVNLYKNHLIILQIESLIPSVVLDFLKKQ